MKNLMPRKLYDSDDTSGTAASKKRQDNINKMLGKVESGEIKNNMSPEEAVKAQQDSEVEKQEQIKERTSSSKEGKESKPEEKKTDVDQEDEQEEKDDLTLLKEQNAALLQQINQLTSLQNSINPGQQQHVQSTIEPVETKTEAEKESEKNESIKATQHPTKIDPIEFVDKDFDTLDASALNVALNKVYQTAYNKGREETILIASKMVHGLVPQYTHLAIESEKFFTKNPELANVRDYTSQVFQEVANKEPKLTLTEKFEKTREEVYNRLRLPGKRTGSDVVAHDVKETKPEVKKPKFGKTGQQTRATETVEADARQKQIDKMLDIAR